MKLTLKNQTLVTSAVLALSAMATQPASASQKCLSKEDIEARFGNAIRSKAPVIDASAIGDMPLCSGLTLAQQLQQLRDEAFPEDVEQRRQAEQRLSAQGAALQATRMANVQSDQAPADSAPGEAIGGANENPGPLPAQRRIGRGNVVPNRQRVSAGAMRQPQSNSPNAGAQAPSKGLAAANANSGLNMSREELSSIIDNPLEYAQFCLNHNAHACYAVEVTVNTYNMDAVLSDDREGWSKEHALAALSAMRQVCAKPNGLGEHSEYCDAADTLNYAIVVNYGPKEQNFRHCLSTDPAFYRTQDVFVDRFGNKDYGKVNSQITGNILKNICKFTLNFSTGSLDGPQTLPPGRVVEVPIGLFGSMLNVNTLHFRWIKRTK